MNYIKKLQKENADLKGQLCAARESAQHLRSYASSEKFIQSDEKARRVNNLDAEYIHKNDVLHRIDAVLSEIHEQTEVLTYTLPSYWASYLVNNDASGLADSDKEDCDTFVRIETREFNQWHVVDCSGESWFAHRNDANHTGGDVLEYTVHARTF
jgi:ABC-type multidrug transport system fused ATPase/permease subunit